MDKKKLAKIALNIRKNAVSAVHAAKSGHPGGSLSIADILAYLYFEQMNVNADDPHWEDRDRLVLSKGHTCPAYYAALAEKVVDELEVVTPGINVPVRNLSGGNVQKILVGREIASEPSVLMSAYAVRGLDINTSYIIYNLMNEQKERGAAVIYVGEDLDVLVELCDRILVLCDGKVSGIVDGRNTTKEEVGLLMTSLGGEKEVVSL